MHVLQLLISYIYVMCTGGSDMDLEVGGDCGTVVTGDCGTIVTGDCNDCIHDLATSSCPRRYPYSLQINIKCIYSFSLKVHTIVTMYVQILGT